MRRSSAIITRLSCSPKQARQGILAYRRPSTLTKIERQKTQQSYAIEVGDPRLPALVLHHKAHMHSARRLAELAIAPISDTSDNQQYALLNKHIPGEGRAKLGVSRTRC